MSNHAPDSDQPEAALAVLHKLNARGPHRDDILTRLAYRRRWKNDSAAYYRQAYRESAQPGWARGSIYFADGKEQQAMNVFNGLLAANEYSLPAYRMVATAIRDLGRPDEAVVLLEQGRARAQGQDPNGRNVGAFTAEIAGYYKQMGDSRRALDEYLDYAAAEPRNFSFGVSHDPASRTTSVARHLWATCRRAWSQRRRGFICGRRCAAAYHRNRASSSSLDMAVRAERTDVRRCVVAVDR